MGNYSKMIGAIVGAILMQLIFRWTGVDVRALGVAAEFQGLVALLVDGAVLFVGGLIAGGVTWAFPANRPREPKT
jgi:hypothetical protein